MTTEPDSATSPVTSLAEALRPDLDRIAKAKLLLAVADETMAATFGAHDGDKPELVRAALDVAALADSHNFADQADSLRSIADSLRRIADAKTPGGYNVGGDGSTGGVGQDAFEAGFAMAFPQDASSDVLIDLILGTLATTRARLERPLTDAGARLDAALAEAIASPAAPDPGAIDAALYREEAGCTRECTPESCCASE